MSWNIPSVSFCNHLNANDTQAPLQINQEDATIVPWTLGVQEHGLAITLQQLKMKVKSSHEQVRVIKAIHIQPKNIRRLFGGEVNFLKSFLIHANFVDAYLFFMDKLPMKNKNKPKCNVSNKAQALQVFTHEFCSWLYFFDKHPPLHLLL